MKSQHPTQSTPSLRFWGKTPGWSWTRAGGLFLAAAFSTTACNESTQCERNRLLVFKAWNSVHQAAYEMKLAGADEDKWAKIEERTDLLRSAFETPQVTWDSANDAIKDVNQMVDSTSTDKPAKLEVFKTSAADATAKQQSFYDACR